MAMSSRAKPVVEVPKVRKAKALEETLPVFRLRDMPMEPDRGHQRDMYWMQYTETVQLRLPLKGPAWVDVDEDEFEVRVGPAELSVRCAGRGGKDSLLESLNGKFRQEVNPKGCWFALERDIYEPTAKHSVLVVELVKKAPGKAWTEDIFHEPQLFNRRAFVWSPTQQSEAQQQQGSLVKLKPGRRSDVQDPFVTSRSWLCTELEQGQTDQYVHFRIVLDQKKLDEALKKVPYYRLFGVDTSERYFKLFIRGDESSPILLGELGGKVLPDLTVMQIGQLSREVPGHRIIGTMETLPCLDVTLVKAKDSQREWEETLTADEDVLNKPQGSLEEYEAMQQRQKREESPDREDWTPDDWADEQKEKADDAFKEGNFRDAIVYYTRALRYTPLSEKLLANRSAAYVKIGKYQLALDDAVRAAEIEPRWSKVHFRKGQALRGLKKWQEAIAAFQDGKAMDPDNPQWDREMQKTREGEAAFREKLATKGR